MSLMRTAPAIKLLAILVLLALCGAAFADCNGDCHSDQCNHGCTHAIVLAACVVSFEFGRQADVRDGTFSILLSAPRDIFEPPKSAV